MKRRRLSTIITLHCRFRREIMLPINMLKYSEENIKLDNLFSVWQHSSQALDTIKTIISLITK